MGTKICTECKLPKSLGDFSKDKTSPSGKCYRCKKCTSNSHREYYNKYPWKRTLINIKQRCNNKKDSHYKNWGGRGIKCLITEEELKKLWYKNKAFNMKCPSIDRKDNKGNYTFNNCRYMEISKNIARQDKTKRMKSINQYDLQGRFIKEWNSMLEIEKELGFNNGAISMVCSGKHKTAYGFIWRLKNE